MTFPVTSLLPVEASLRASRPGRPCSCRRLLPARPRDTIRHRDRFILTEADPP